MRVITSCLICLFMFQSDSVFGAAVRDAGKKSLNNLVESLKSLSNGTPPTPGKAEDAREAIDDPETKDQLKRLIAALKEYADDEEPKPMIAVTTQSPTTTRTSPATEAAVDKKREKIAQLSKELLTLLQEDSVYNESSDTSQTDSELPPVIITDDGRVDRLEKLLHLSQDVIDQLQGDGAKTATIHIPPGRSLSPRERITLMLLLEAIGVLLDTDKPLYKDEDAAMQKRWFGMSCKKEGETGCGYIHTCCDELFCVEGTCVSCSPEGGRCDDNADCCGRLSCEKEHFYSLHKTCL